MVKRREIITSNDTKIFLTEKGVVNKDITDAIRGATEEDLEIAVSMESMLDPEVRTNVVSDVVGFLHQLYEGELISQFDVMCDRRNNTSEMSSSGTTHLSVKFKQWNCLNYTTLEYEIIRKPRFVKKKSKGRVIL